MSIETTISLAALCIVLALVGVCNEIKKLQKVMEAKNLSHNNKSATIAALGKLICAVNNADEKTLADICSEAEKVLQQAHIS